jgi:hypothetical protein
MNKLSESYERREKFSQRMGKFGLKKHSTKIPVISSATKSRQHQLEVIQDMTQHRRACVILPPPISVKRTWEMKGREFRESKIERETGRSTE